MKTFKDYYEQIKKACRFQDEIYKDAGIPENSSGTVILKEDITGYKKVRCSGKRYYAIAELTIPKGAIVVRANNLKGKCKTWGKDFDGYNICEEYEPTLSNDYRTDVVHVTNITQLIRDPMVYINDFDTCKCEPVRGKRKSKIIFEEGKSWTTELDTDHSDQRLDGIHFFKTRKEAADE